MENKLIRLTESDLHRIVKESARRIIIEKRRPSGVDNTGKRIFRKEANPVTGKMKKSTYYPMNDAGKYASANGLDAETMYKVGKIKARPSVYGQQHQGTVLDGGFQERGGFTERGNGSMIVRNPKGEEYEVPGDEFAKKYTHVGDEPDENGFSTYNAFDKRQISDPVKHNVYKNMPNWGKGQKQFGRQGDAHMVNPGTNDSYFIGDKELYSTHVRNPHESRNRTLKLTESDIHNLVKESVMRILKEEGAGDHMDARDSCAREYREKENNFYKNLSDVGIKIVGNGIHRGSEYATQEIALGIPKNNINSFMSPLKKFMEKRGWKSGDPHHDDGAYVYVLFIRGVQNSHLF